MTDLRKAAEMALNTLTKSQPLSSSMTDVLNLMETIRLLRQALAQPEQEPVAYADSLDLAKDGNWDTFICKHASENHEGTRFKVPLFTAPPREHMTQADLFDLAHQSLVNEIKRLSDLNERLVATAEELGDADDVHEWDDAWAKMCKLMKECK